MVLTGVNVAMSTPFKGNSEALDEERFYTHIDHLIEAGVHGLVLNSGTGEFAYMSDSEAADIGGLGIDYIEGRVPVTVQTSAVSLKLCIDKSKAAEDGGADALMVLPPWLDGPFARGVMHHYATLADAVDLPIVIYNIPQISGIEITAEMWAELSQHPNIAHIKDSTGDIAKMQSLIAAGPGVMGGCDPVAPYALIAGACGWIWGAANVMPSECVQLYELLTDGRIGEAMELWFGKMLSFNSYIWDNADGAEYNTAVKTAAGLRFGDLGPPRLPQLPLLPNAVAAIRACLAPLD